MRELGDIRGEGVSLGQLGTLALREGDLAEAVKSYREALTLFQRLNEPLIGICRPSPAWYGAGPSETMGRSRDTLTPSGRAKSVTRSDRWTSERGKQLGAISESSTIRAGRPEAAETWFRKVIEVTRQAGDKVTLSKTLSNLAALLMAQTVRLAEARQLAEEALAIKKTLDPGRCRFGGPTPFWPTSQTRRKNRNRLPNTAALRVMQNGPSPVRLTKCGITCRLSWEPAKPSRILRKRRSSTAPCRQWKNTGGQISSEQSGGF